MDERNINPAIESLSLTNHLLSGVDLQGQKAEQAGFAIFGSQNPVSMGARVNLCESEAQQRRMVAVKVPLLSQKSQRAILKAKGLSIDMAHELTYIYNENFREVLEQANTMVKRMLELDLGVMDEFLACEQYTSDLKKDFVPDITLLQQQVVLSLKDKEATLRQLNTFYKQTSALTYQIKCALGKEKCQIQSRYSTLRFLNKTQEVEECQKEFIAASTKSAAVL